MKNKIWIATIKPEDLERRSVKCFDGSFVDISKHCGYLSTLDLGKLVFRRSDSVSCGEVEVEDNLTRQRRLRFFKKKNL